MLDGLTITPEGEAVEDTGAGAGDTRDIIIHLIYRNRLRSIPKVQSNNNGEGKSPNKLEVKRVDLAW